MPTTKTNPDRLTKERLRALRETARRRQASFTTPIRAIIDLDNAERLHNLATGLGRAHREMLESFGPERNDEEAAALMSHAVEGIRLISDTLDAMVCDMNASCALGSDLSLAELEQLRAGVDVNPRPVTWGADPADD